jgi:hypothetical protein
LLMKGGHQGRHDAGRRDAGSVFASRLMGYGPAPRHYFITRGSLPKKIGKTGLAL